jgi:hypothetical protein
MMKSVVGDPIFWPGLVYSPININGLIFALGTVTGEVGLLFEEFSEAIDSAVCRRKTEDGWEKITAGLSVKSSDYQYTEKPDLLICWVNDGDVGDDELPVLELSKIKGNIHSKSSPVKNVAGLKNIFPEDPAEDLLHRGETISDFEETIRQLDQRIKKLKNEQ